MISENEVSAVIRSEIPMLAIGMSSKSDSNKLYRAVTYLAEYTKELIREHKADEAIRCFETASELLQEGSSLVKLAVVSIFINSVSRLLENSFCSEQVVKSDFLARFGREYCQLVYAKNP